MHEAGREGVGWQEFSLNHNRRMLARLMAFLVWGLLACSGTYWFIQVAARPLATPSQALPVVEQTASQVDLSRLLGASAVAAVEAPPAEESRFKLLGVVAPKSARGVREGEGVALISVDGVARTVRVGSVIDGELKLLAVDARSASLGRDGVASMNLQLAAPTRAATGALPLAGPSAVNLGGNNAIQPQVMPPMPAGVMPPQILRPDSQQPQSTPPVDNRGNPLS